MSNIVPMPKVYKKEIKATRTAHYIVNGLQLYNDG